MYCNKCGAEINIDEDFFCINCGAKISRKIPAVEISSGLTSDAEESVRIIDDFFIVDERKIVRQAALTDELNNSIAVTDDDLNETLPKIDIGDIEFFEIPEIVLEFKGPDEEGESTASSVVCPDLPNFTEELIVREGFAEGVGDKTFEKSVEENAEKTMAMVDEMLAELASSENRKSNDARNNLSKAVDAALAEERKNK